MAKTARAIITSALKKIGAIASGETPSASELQDGLSALQGMIDSWSTNDLLSFVESEETFTLIPGQSEYTIGTGGDFDTARPLDILSVAVLDAGGLEIPVSGLTFEQWDSVTLKNLQSTYPSNYYYRTEFPLGKLIFFPVPQEARQVQVVSRKPFATVATVNTELSLPPGYDDALIFNLALELVDDYGGQVSPLTLQRAEEKLNAIKSQNLSKNIPFAASDSSLTGNAGSGWSIIDLLKGGS